MPAADLAQLPNDLLIALADFLPDAGLKRLAQTNRRLFAILDRILYSRDARRKDSRTLHWAAYYGVSGTVIKALAAGADPNISLPQKLHPAYSYLNTTLPYGRPLTTAVGHNELEIASLLIEAGAIRDDALLLAAVGSNHLEMTKLLVSTGIVDPDSPALHEENILNYAICQGASLPLIEYVLSLQKNTDIWRPTMPIPIISAVQMGRLDVIQLLLGSPKINPCQADKHHRNALIWAAEAPTEVAESMVQQLLGSATFDVNSADNKGRTAISLAASKGNEAVVRLLLSAPNIDPNLVDNTGLAPVLHALKHTQIVELMMASDKVNIPVDGLFEPACVKASTEIIKRLLKLDQAKHNATDSSGSTWLHAAATCGRTDIVRFLLKQKDAPINHQRLDGMTPLICAVRYKTNDLLHSGANVSIIDIYDRSSLSYASENSNHALVVQELLSRGARMTATIDAGETPLHLACRQVEPRLVQVLLAHGADPVLRSANNQTPLHIACICGREQTVRLLLQKIPHGHPILQTGHTPLHDACSSGNADIVRHLLDHGANPVANLGGGVTPLELASSSYPDIVEILLERGANPRQITSLGATVLHCACVENTSKVVSLLLQHGADPNGVDTSGGTALHQACFDGTLDIVRVLLEHGADVSLAKQDGSTPLHEACRGSQRGGIAKMLIDKGANVHSRMQNGQTPLHVACENGFSTLVPGLLFHGADALAEFFEDKTGQLITPYHLACRSRTSHYSPLLLFLMKLERPASEIWTSGWTPLHEAAAAVNKDAVRLLLEHGFNPMAVTEDGRTALHLVFRHVGQPVWTLDQSLAYDVIRLLLDVGKIDVNHRDDAGKTALGEAAGANEYCRALLRGRGAII